MSPQSPLDPDLEARVAAIIKKLRERGQRLTPQRLAIITNFVARGDHPSAEALYRELHEAFPMMAISTVYNTLRTLVELGEAIEVSPATPEARFDPNTGSHYHLVCLNCRSIEDVPMERPPLNVPKRLLGQEPGFQPVVHVHQVLGYCAVCQAETGKTE